MSVPTARTASRSFLAVCVLSVSCGLSLQAWAVDTDGDGVDDNVDAFPNNAEATTDTDSDGNPDSIDALKIPVFDNFESGVVTGWVLTTYYPASTNWGISTQYSVSGSKSLQLTAYRDVSRNSTVASLSITLQTQSTISWYQRSVFDPLATGYARVMIDGGVVMGCTSSGQWFFCVAQVSPGAHTLALSVNSGGMTGNYEKIFIDDLRVGSILIEDTDDDNDGLPDVMDPLPLQAQFNLNSVYKGSAVAEQDAPQ